MSTSPAAEKHWIPAFDGTNERGLVVGVLYLPGFAEFQPYDPAHAREGFKTFPWISKNHKKLRM